jgi:hypothetical protein
MTTLLKATPIQVVFGALRGPVGDHQDLAGSTEDNHIRCVGFPARRGHVGYLGRVLVNVGLL